MISFHTNRLLFDWMLCISGQKVEAKAAVVGPRVVVTGAVVAVEETGTVVAVEETGTVVEVVGQAPTQAGQLHQVENGEKKLILVGKRATSDGTKKGLRNGRGTAGKRMATMSGEMAIFISTTKQTGTMVGDDIATTEWRN